MKIHNESVGTEEDSVTDDYTYEINQDCVSPFSRLQVQTTNHSALKVSFSTL